MSSSTRDASDRIYGGQERDERVAERRARLIDAGICLFGSRGYHAITLRTLIVQAGLATRYFYESFDTMESLLVACYDHLMDQYRSRLNQALLCSQASVEDVARAGLRCYFEEMQNPHFARITQIEILGVSPAVDEIYNKATRDFGAKIIATFAGLTNAKAFSKIEADLLGIALAGAVSTAGTHWSRDGFRRSLDQMVEGTLVVLMGTAEQLYQLTERTEPVSEPRTARRAPAESLTL